VDVRSLTRDLNKLGFLGKSSSVGKAFTIARNFQKSRSFSGLLRDFDKAGLLLKPGTLNRAANLARNFQKSRSLRGLFRDFDKMGLVTKPGTLGKVASLAADFGKTRSLSGLFRNLDKAGLLAKPGSLGKFATLAGNFGKSRTLGEFINSASPLLKMTARMAAPTVGAAIGGRTGAMAANMLTKMLREGEAGLFELEDEFELETEPEGLHETELEIFSHELTYHEALAEMMAEAAEQEQNEGEAEAMAGAATLTVISPADRRALRSVLPHLVRGTAVLTRILRANPDTRPAVRAVPTIARRTVQVLKRQAEAGTPITRRTAGRAAAREVRRVLGSPVACATAMANNVWAAQTLRGAAA